MKKIRFIAVIMICAFAICPTALADDSKSVENEVCIPLPIIMYHSILKNPAAQGKYVVSPDVLEQDMKYLKDNGYTSIRLAQLIDYVYNGTELPSKPVLLTFDDAYLNNMTYVLPLLEQYDMYAVISIVGEFTDIFSDNPDPNPNYAHFTWEDIKIAADSGRFEIGNHTYGLHRMKKRQGSKKLPGESTEDYQNMLTADLLKLQESLNEKSGVKPVVFTYPYGLVSEDSVELIKELGFQASLGCSEFINGISKNPECLYLMGRYNRPGGISTEAFMKKLLK